ncbi:MAG: WSD1 family O-acyltransferase, partial [Myxococcales bacterium]|nr:WSD1 family O-acyltransferase [Myxococcales bacterium]
NGASLEGMYPLSIVSHGQALNITVTSCGDSLDFGIIACRRSVPHAQRLIDHLDEALVELERSVSS